MIPAAVASGSDRDWSINDLQCASRELHATVCLVNRSAHCWSALLSVVDCFPWPQPEPFAALSDGQAFFGERFAPHCSTPSLALTDLGVSNPEPGASVSSQNPEPGASSEFERVEDVALDIRRNLRSRSVFPPARTLQPELWKFTPSDVVIDLATAGSRQLDYTTPLLWSAPC